MAQMFSFGNDLIWEDMIYWQDSSERDLSPQPVLGKDWDVIMYNDVDNDVQYPVVVSNFASRVKYTIPTLNGIDYYTVTRIVVEPNSLAIAPGGRPIQICKTYNYSSGSNEDCSDKWTSSSIIPSANVDPLVAHGYTMGYNFNYSYIKNEKDKNKCIREKKWGMPCDGKADKYCDPKLSNWQKYFGIWGGCADGASFVDNHRILPTINCDSSACNTTNIHVNYYMPPALTQACHGLGCVDNPTLYPTMKSINANCLKRGYDWGIFNATTIYVGKSCGGTFNNYQVVYETTCTPSNDYTFKSCSISNELYSNDPSIDNGGDEHIRCTGVKPACATTGDGSNFTDPICTGVDWSCPNGYCDTHIDDLNCKDKDGEAVISVCNIDTWKCPEGSTENPDPPKNDDPDKSGSSLFYILLFIFVLLLAYGLYNARGAPTTQDISRS